MSIISAWHVVHYDRRIKNYFFWNFKHFLNKRIFSIRPQLSSAEKQKKTCCKIIQPSPYTNPTDIANYQQPSPYTITLPAATISSFATP